MRIAVSGPRKWKELKTRMPLEASLASQWLSVQLDLITMKEEVEAATTLQLGVDTLFAILCESKGIPYTVFLACKDQDKFWDEEARETFAYLLERASNIKYIGELNYKKGCINKQNKAVTKWITQTDGVFFVINNKFFGSGYISKEKVRKITWRIKYAKNR